MSDHNTNHKCVKHNHNIYKCDNEHIWYHNNIGYHLDICNIYNNSNHDPNKHCYIKYNWINVANNDTVNNLYIFYIGFNYT